jgi:ribonuclease Z
MAERFEVAFLGTTGPLMNPERCGSGTVIVAGETNVLIDCGWGAARRLLLAGIPPGTVDVAVFTHMHSDHITDFPDFFFLRWTGGATRPLRVFGPEGTKDMVDGFLLALRRDVGFRLAHHGDALSPEGAKVEVVEVPATPKPEDVVEVAGLRIRSFEVDHFPVVPAFGYDATFDGRRVVVSGDTKVCPTFAAAAQGADLIVSDALNLELWEQRRAALRAAGQARIAKILGDVPEYHISTLEVARLAAEAGVRELALTHLLPPIGTDAAAIASFTAGMAELFAGPIHVPRDAQRIAVPGRR